MHHNEGLKSFYISMLWRLYNKVREFNKPPWINLLLKGSAGSISPKLVPYILILAHKNKTLIKDTWVAGFPC